MAREKREIIRISIWSGINSMTIIKTDYTVVRAFLLQSYIQRARISFPGSIKKPYLNPDGALGFPLLFFLSKEVLVPNSPRSGCDIVWKGPKLWLWV